MNPTRVIPGWEWDRSRGVEELAQRAAERTVLVLGGTSGIGRAIAEALLEKGAKRIVVVGRTFTPSSLPPLGDAAAPAAELEFVEADLSSMKTCSRLFEDNEALKALLPQLTDIVFTVGTMSTRQIQFTAEKLERDMATSFLSRLAVVRELQALRQSSPGAVPAALRLFVFGFPGADEHPDDVHDLNGEWVYQQWLQHNRTVIGNESLVHAVKADFPVFGLNPGLVKTGIRENLYGEQFAFFAPVAEFFIGLFTPTAAKYANLFTRFFLAPELDAGAGVGAGAEAGAEAGAGGEYANKACAMSGGLFDSKFHDILPNPYCTDPEHVATFMAEADKLIDLGVNGPPPKETKEAEEAKEEDGDGASATAATAATAEVDGASSTAMAQT